MAERDLETQIKEVLAADRASFQERVKADADDIKAAIADGVFDNPQAIMGLEYEFYAVSRPTTAGEADDSECCLQRVPRRLLSFIRFEKELGLHNAELSTSPLPLNPDGLRAQEAAVAAQLQTANQYLREEGLAIVSDGLWTISPQGESARRYLTNCTDADELNIASNMSKSPRYHAMANANGDVTPAMTVDAPHVTLSAKTVMPESLITSIQPHYQIPEAETLPELFRYALRVAGPLLALGVNSPLFPPDLYDDDADAEAILADAWLGHRIAVFETALNPTDGRKKVCFPRDVESVEEAVDRIVDDNVLVPMPVGDGQHEAFQTKHGTYWRWVRPVFGGTSRSRANARIEFRPIAAQPTVRDSIAFQAVFGGLMERLTEADHPVTDLEWSVARENFYNAAENGLDADLTWISRDGTETTDTDALFADLLDFAAEGLRSCGFSEETVGRYVGPLRRRVRYGLTPAGWKLQQVQDELDAGRSFEDAVTAMQRRYIRQQADTLLDGEFGAWLEDYSYRVQ